MMKLYIVLMSIFCAFLNSQVVPHNIPLSHNLENSSNYSYLNKAFNQTIRLKPTASYNSHHIFQLGILFDEKNLNRVEFSISGISNYDNIYIIDSDNKTTYLGPYQGNGTIISNPIYAKSAIIEVNSDVDEIEIVIHNFSTMSNYISLSEEKLYYKNNNNRDEPIILLTGYWPPTNEMIRHFSQNLALNSQGWQGDNWEDRGYDIVSYFPEFSPPDCSSCGQGFGDIEVDYQDTSEDFWPISNNNTPLGVITFSRGYMDLSWEMEYNAYNRTNWYNDFTSPFLPTPNPPDTQEEAFYLRNSNLPMQDIVDAISALDIGLNPYIDFNGDPGHYVSEFMAYHGTWYRDLNQFGDDNCISAGHIHVGGNIDWGTARIATEESIRVLIDYLDSFSYTPGDLNQDEIIDILDLVIVINYILGQGELSNIQIYAADINEDTIINIQDIIVMINLILN